MAHLKDVLVGNHFFVIFAVLDVSFAVNSCLNRGFFTFIIIKELSKVTLSQLRTVTGALYRIHMSLRLE